MTQSDSVGPLPTIEDVRDAAIRLRGHAVRTPLLHSPVLSSRAGRLVFLKPECLQRTGSFKFRGAYNRISRLAEAARMSGVVACSSGNHAQGVAAAAALCDIPATIVMPSDAPTIKRDNTAALGAEIVTYDRVGEDRDAIALSIAEREGRVVIPPYDDPLVIAGQGTIGLEIAEDAAQLGIEIEVVLVPAGGGGLSAGTALALKSASPATSVHVVEPVGFDDHVRSLASGVREVNERLSGSICDALLAPSPGEITFALNRVNLAGAVAVADEEVERAVATAFRDLKLVVEPGGAVGLAALLSGKAPAGEGPIVVVLSGGNIDAGLFCRLIGADHPNIAS